MTLKTHSQEKARQLVLLQHKVKGRDGQTMRLWGRQRPQAGPVGSASKYRLYPVSKEQGDPRNGLHGVMIRLDFTLPVALERMNVWKTRHFGGQSRGGDIEVLIQDSIVGMEQEGKTQNYCDIKIRRAHYRHR